MKKLAFLHAEIFNQHRNYLLFLFAGAWSPDQRLRVNSR